MRYTIEQRVFMYDEYIKRKSFVECCVAFIHKYPGVKVPRKSVVRKLVAKFRTTGSMLDKADEMDKKRSKNSLQLQGKRKSARPFSAKSRRLKGPVTKTGMRSILGDMDVNNGESDSDDYTQEPCDEPQLIFLKAEPPDTSSNGSSDSETEQAPFACVNIKQEVQDDVDMMESDSDSDTQELCDEAQVVCSKRDSPDTSSSELLPSTCVNLKKEFQEPCDGSRLIRVKAEPPDASSDDSLDSGTEQVPLACVNIKEEVQDANDLQSDFDCMEQNNSEAVLGWNALPITKPFESKAAREQVLFTSVEVKCEIEDEEAVREEDGDQMADKHEGGLDEDRISFSLCNSEGQIAGEQKNSYK